jgi:hypothetical protein
MTDKLIGAAIFGVTAVVWVWAQEQEIYALHGGAYGFFTLAAIVLARRTSA